MGKRGKYLTFYMQSMRSGGLMKYGGICANLWDSDLSLFKPDNKSQWEFWAFRNIDSKFRNKLPYDFRRKYEFTPLRQNIVLFMAAMNGEL